MIEDNDLNGADKVLEVLKARLGEDKTDDLLAADIERARVMLLCYCNIPLVADMPQGLFEAWCMVAEQYASGMGEVSSVSEGDVSITFKKSGEETLGWKTIADRFKRMAV